MATNIENKYVKLDPREHVLARPGMYIGSLESDSISAYVIEEDKMKKRNFAMTPGLYKIFDEILVNAIDHSVRLRQDASTENQVKNIKVSINTEDGSIEVLNDGDSIDVAFHQEHDMYIPEMIFGNLMTSTNYDDTEERIIGGQNGIGAKACNIFSSKFNLELVDHKSQKLYKQEWTDNMSAKTAPKITKCVKKPYTKITFIPDFKRFGIDDLINEDMFALFKKRCYDVCALTPDNINVFFNGEKLLVKNFERYVDLYIGTKKEQERVFGRIDDRWDVVVSYNENSGFEQVSFVNGIWTMRGGKHVDYLSSQICCKLADLILKRKKIEVKTQHIKNSLTLFVKCTISNPTFDSQTKDLLTTPMSKFGSKPDVDSIIEKIYKMGIVDNAINLNSISEGKQLKKSDGKKQSTLRNIPKLDDAKFAGTAKSKDCILILTEGDSAKAMALAGLDVVGRDYYGVFPLRGKLLNVKDCVLKKISENEEITNIKKIVGLESGKEYDSIDELRYGKIMIMTDADEDGFHIKGLLFNMFHTLWPSLFHKDDFICALRTPIIKVRKNKECISFYHLSEYEAWKKAVGGAIKQWHVKYYKGLATSTAVEAKEYFKEMNMTTYVYNEQNSDDAIDMAFNKKRADDRKDWLSHYDSNTIIENIDNIIYEDFINKELIHFSNYDIERSIPNLCDGMKISQRKIMFGCHKRNLVNEIRVAQLASYVSEHTSYHHGEASLQAAIINMAQDFVGSNNINLLYPNGQFGTRAQGGKDSGSPRYIYTFLSEITPKIIRTEDECILQYLNDDGCDIEPQTYFPIIPLVIVNGALGIGTGFSTNIPCYNPSDVVNYLIAKLDNEDMDTKLLHPWYRGFTGTIESDSNNKWVCRGKYKTLVGNKIEINEIPVGAWTNDYKEMLEKLTDTNPGVKGYTNDSSNGSVKFTVQFASQQALESTDIESTFKLVSNKISTTNMYLFNQQGQITKYDTVYAIIDEYYGVRLDAYVRRKANIITKMEKDLRTMSERIRFLDLVINRDLTLHDKNKSELEEYLDAHMFEHHNDSYDFLVKMPIYNMTKDKQDSLKEEHLKKTSELGIVRLTSPSDMWRKELYELKPLL
jgi:DNA topoisomerase-2